VLKHSKRDIRNMAADFILQLAFLANAKINKNFTAPV
jgi:hypothetical protein